ncbi:MAG TPA: hypothetical protein VI300_15505 [Solirubrobacter sp.]
MRRRATILLALGSGLGIGLGATALAQSGDNDLRIDLHRGCLTGTRVTIRIVPPSDAILSPVHIRAGGREVVHLTGVTQEASVTVRLPHEGRVSVSGETTGGERFSVERNYRRCAPAASPHDTAPTPPISGGGEG